MSRRCRRLTSRFGYLNSWRRSARSRIQIPSFLLCSFINRQISCFVPLPGPGRKIFRGYQSVILVFFAPLIPAHFSLPRPRRQTPGGNQPRPDLQPQTVGSISTGQPSSAQPVNRRSRPLASSGRMTLQHPLRTLAEVARRGR